MTPELAYFLKINIAIALFYAFYRLFFYRDTFFQWRRTALLCFLVISPLYPVLNIQEWIRSHEPMVAMVDLYATIVLPEIEITPEVRAADWQSIILSTVNIIYRPRGVDCLRPGVQDQPGQHGETSSLL